MASDPIAPPLPLAAPPKADAADFPGRFREIISDPINLLIPRHPAAGTVADGHVRLHNGVEVGLGGDTAYYGEFSQILVLNRGVHEPLEEYAFQQLLTVLPDSPFMLELGSYWAHYSMWMLRRRPAATVVMVEPEPANMAAGRANFARNGLLGEFIEDIVAPGRFEVDRFRAERGVGKIDLLHADIQGAEVDMLVAAGTALADRAIDRLFISTHGQDLHQSVIDRLEAHGYRIEVSSDFDHETTAFDGLVVASSPDVPRIFDSFRPLSRPEIAGASPEMMLARLIEHREQAERRLA